LAFLAALCLERFANAPKATLLATLDGVLNSLSAPSFPTRKPRRMSVPFAENLSISPSVQRNGPIHADLVFLLPIVVLVAALVVVRLLNVDTMLADFIYQAGGHRWMWRGKWLTAELLHKDAQKFSIFIGVATLGVIIASGWSKRLKPYRRGLVATFSAAIIALLLVSLSKHEIPLACPWDLQRYGGDLIGGSPFHLFWNQDISGCFPAGHAAGGYCLLVWFFFARHYRFKYYPLALLPGILLGLTYAVTQELRGAHFLSHDLSAILLCWVVGYVVFRLIVGNQMRLQTRHEADDR